MPKQTIEIDVPEGYEIDFIAKSASPQGKEIPYLDITVYFIKKEPEFIEVREYLHRSDIYVLHNSIQKDLHQKASDIESLPGFIRWIDEDWRKIYI